jgi:anti-sigma regulatory factor (Ser/Thr protein kinase)
LSTVELLLSPQPHHVRTARLVGVAAARRAGLPDELVDELRWALGEATSRAVALHAQHAPDVPVRVVLREDPTGLTVEVVDAGPEGLPPDDTDPSQLFDGDVVDHRVSLAVLAGLVDDVEVTPSSGGTTVRLRWPLLPRSV